MLPPEHPTYSLLHSFTYSLITVTQYVRSTQSLTFILLPYTPTSYAVCARSAQCAKHTIPYPCRMCMCVYVCMLVMLVVCPVYVYVCAVRLVRLIHAVRLCSSVLCCSSLFVLPVSVCLYSSYSFCLYYPLSCSTHSIHSSYSSCSCCLECLECSSCSTPSSSLPPHAFPIP